MPDATVTASAWLLAAVFAIAATTKLRDPLGTRQSLGDFGLPNPRLLARILPATEVATACCSSWTRDLAASVRWPC